LRKLLFGALLLALATASFAQDILFKADPDIKKGVILNYMSTTAPNKQGEVFQLASPNSSITGFDLPLVSNFWQTPNGVDSFRNVQLKVTFFAGFQTSFTGSGPQFSDPIGTFTFNLGPQQMAKGRAYPFTGSSQHPRFPLPHPIHVTGDKIGVQFTFLVDEGRGLVPSDHVTLVTSIVTPVTGDNGFVYNGYQYQWFTPKAHDSSTSIPQKEGEPSKRANYVVTLYGSQAHAGPKPKRLKR
jgi:hypothetical protein